MDCPPTSAEACLIQAALAFASRRAPGSTLRRITLTLEGPEGRQLVSLDPADWWLAQARAARQARQATSPPDVIPLDAGRHGRHVTSAGDLTEAEQAVLEALADGRPRAGPVLAAESGYTYGHLRNVLPGLVRRGLLTHSRRHGYALAPAHSRDVTQPGGAGGHNAPRPSETEGDDGDHDDDDRDTG